MSNGTDDFLFSDEDSEKKVENLPKEHLPKEQWSVLIVDDEKDVHEITKLLFRGFEFEGKAINFLSAFSAQEARTAVMNDPDIGLILLDVVMEEDNSGLEFAKYLRDELKNKLTRIIIRTGQPGMAPEKEVIVNYDINDYKEKTELSQDKLYFSVIMALRSYRDLIGIQRAKEEIQRLLIATDRFVPHHFLRTLNKKDITDISLGEHTQIDVAVMFLDIRSFTILSEKLTPIENFKFVNTLLEIVEPFITKSGGFIDKYIGDAFMALFLGEVESAIIAGIDMLTAWDQYNLKRSELGQQPIHVGISINSGMAALGTIGYHDRMDCTVIGSVVNTAAKLEKMNKEFSTHLLVTGDLFDKVANKEQFAHRNLGGLVITGKTLPVKIVEIFNTDTEDMKKLKLQTKPLLEKAIAYFAEGNFQQAHEMFNQILAANQKDTVAEYFIKKCKQLENK